MKYILYFLLIVGFILSCKTSKPSTASKKDENLEALKQNDTVTIANKEEEYEIIIIEPGFNYWVASQAQPRGFYSQTFLENRNQLYVIEWNQRVLQPQRYPPNLYELQINYDQGTDYGYEVNYLLYNYFIYFQLTYKQRLGPFVPRI
ncbi:DUF6146 family protein [Tamlana sp. 2_MG-2023]|uniref:DUF6146 family protein n=1 Tax=unclassified Tamlana TaxID=2614803 RepID=UPI0026E40B1C|nr:MULTISPECIES: DUF6146 family protein [unclassified Tamlana]MDO6758814.1 DUF6146 family protein [Tamlana sp. 2_MG-2023]MDO6789513.1 DUF6146 family protein [Tamlana sp. 1_MG-2023]